MSDNRAKKMEPPKRRNTGGRPAIDWPKLYDEWSGSGLPIRDFLDKYGLSLKSSTTRAMVSGWRRGDTAAKKRMEHVAKMQNPNKVEPSNLWQIVQQWRAGQAETDYKTANAIRQHINALLSRGVLTNADGKIESKLSPRDLINLADAAATVQKMQRLALGMTTDNVGVAQPDESHVDQTDDAPDCPIFVVEVSDSGKFKRARPKQIQ